MSLSSLILRPEAGRYVLGAYLAFNTLSTALLTATLTILLPETDPIQLFASSFFSCSLIIVIFYYSGFHDRLLARQLKNIDQLLIVPATPTLSEVSQLPFLQRSKDAYLGTMLLYYTLVLFTFGVIGGTLLLLEPLPNKVGATGAAIAFAVWSFLWLRQRTGWRKKAFSDQLLLSWRYFILQQTLSENQLETTRFKRLETQLSMGAWSFVRITLRKYADELRQELECSLKSIQDYEKFLTWCEQQAGAPPKIELAFGRITELSQLGFQFVTPDTKLLPDLTEMAEPLRKLYSDISTNYETTAPTVPVLSENQALIDRARVRLPDFGRRLRKQIASKFYLLGIEPLFDE